MIMQSYKKKKRTTPEDIACARYHMRKNGIGTYDKKSMVRSVIGGSMIIIGLATLPIPCTTIPLCICGSGLIGYDLRRLIKKVRYESHLLKVRLFAW